MTRGLGTALGVAVASLVYGLVVGTAAGSPVGPAQASAGLRAAGVVLALGAAAAGVLASMRDQRFA
jgi:hypothetical protein